MTIRILGALLIVSGCTGVGYAMSYCFRREEQAMEDLVKCLEWMVCEMNYRMPPLAALFLDAANMSKGTLSQTMERFAVELQQQVSPNPAICMYTAIAAVPTLPERVSAHLQTLATNLGYFDLEGQLDRLEAAVSMCRQDLHRMSSGKEIRMRNYQTLGLCAGVALVIIFI